MFRYLLRNTKAKTVTKKIESKTVKQEEKKEKRKKKRKQKRVKRKQKKEMEKEGYTNNIKNNTNPVTENSLAQKVMPLQHIKKQTAMVKKSSQDCEWEKRPRRGKNQTK